MGKSKPYQLLFPLASLSPWLRFTLAIFPTFLALTFHTWLPSVLQITPAVLSYPLVLIAVWLGGWRTGTLSALMCSLHNLFFIRPHLLQSPLEDLPGFLRSIMFLTTSLLFIWLIHNLQKALETVTRSIKLRDEFLSIFSHELRTPLTSLRFSVELSKETLQNDSEEEFKKMMPQNLDRLDRHLSEIERLTHTMFDTAFIETGKLNLNRERIDLAKVAQSVVESMRLNAEKQNVTLSVQAEEPVYGDWDPVRIEQVLTNLIRNALQYAPGSLVEVNVGKDIDFAIVSVKDHGKGIPEPIQKRIFQKFERGVSNGETKGLGLGLYLSHSIATAHGGEIRLESEPNQGAHFKVLLPLTNVL